MSDKDLEEEADREYEEFCPHCKRRSYMACDKELDRSYCTHCLPSGISPESINVLPTSCIMCDKEVYHKSICEDCLSYAIETVSNPHYPLMPISEGLTYVPPKGTNKITVSDQGVSAVIELPPCPTCGDPDYNCSMVHGKCGMEPVV